MLIRKYRAAIAVDGGSYDIQICGQARTDGTWEGWIEFHSTGDGSILRTEQETSQPNLAALEYWADGLDPIYFEGALARAQGRFL